MKPITYYLDTPFTRDIAAVHGAKLEGLRSDQKFEWIGLMGIWMAVLLTDGTDEDGNDAPVMWQALPISEHPSAEILVIANEMNNLDDMGPRNCALLIVAIAQTMEAE
jgi:hypothetical protein